MDITTEFILKLISSGIVFLMLIDYIVTCEIPTEKGALALLCVFALVVILYMFIPKKQSCNLCNKRESIIPQLL